MDAEAKVRLVQRWWDELWGGDDLSVLGEICTDPYTRHTGLGTETLSLAEYERRVRQQRQVLRNAITTIDAQVVDGDTVWTRATSRGVDFTAIDKSVMTWITVHRIEGDRIAEVWVSNLPGVEWES
jgi:hypothetical protein